MKNATLAELTAKYEMKIINETLARTKSIRQAARELGIHHTTLLKKIKRYEER